jgi:hypothetical protein
VLPVALLLLLSLPLPLLLLLVSSSGSSGASTAGLPLALAGRGDTARLMNDCSSRQSGTNTNTITHYSGQVQQATPPPANKLIRI